MTLAEILNLFNYYLGRFIPDTPDEKTQKIRALNIAKDILISQLGLPSSERTTRINFVEEKELYVLPSDFVEPIALYYDETQSSIYSRTNRTTKFEFIFPEEIHSLTLAQEIVYWGIDNSDGSKKLLIKAFNTRRPFIIDDCDTTENWTALNDATYLVVDRVRFKTGAGSLKFKIDKTLSGVARASLKFTLPMPLDSGSWVNNGNFFINLYIVNPTGLSSVTLKWGSSATDYYLKTETTNADGLFPQANSWNEFIFSWENAIAVGSPNPSQISFFQIDIDYDESQFVSPQYWNLDTLVLFSQDKFVLRYYSNLMVRNASTGNLKKDFENDDDVAVFAEMDPSLGDLVARLAAVMYRPIVETQTGNDTAFLSSINTEILEAYRLRYPKRTPLYYRGRIKPPTYRYLQ